MDLVLCLDTTASMEPYFDDIRKNLGDLLRQRVAEFSRFRIGVVLYKDYWPDEYITRNYPYTSDISAVERIVKSATVYGGGDIPEAEVEALFAAATEFEWSADKRQVIVLTDAPPHPDPRGKILFDDVVREAEAKGIALDVVTEPMTMPSPPDPDHQPYENESKRLASLSAGGTTIRIAAFADGPAPNEPLDANLIAAFSAASRIWLGDVSSPNIAAARQKAAALGATHLIIVRTRSAGAFSETVSRLLDAGSGIELAHDVVWRARSAAGEAVFVNGVRVK